METKIFFVQGSSQEPYCVEFFYRNNILSATCSCNAGKNSKPCKHRDAILDGSKNAIINYQVGDHNAVLFWYKTSDIKQKREEIIILEKALEEVKKKIETAKKQLSNLYNR